MAKKIQWKSTKNYGRKSEHQILDEIESVDDFQIKLREHPSVFY